MKKLLTFPLTIEQIKDLKIGDTVYYTGLLFTARDSGHKRMVTDGIMPEDLPICDGGIYHAGPIVKMDKNGKYNVIAAGPTTSRRMEDVEAALIAGTGVRLIIGKGGMMDKTAAACKEYGAVHCAFPGGCAIVAANEVEEVVDLRWSDLGMPEALWVLKVREFGPLIVSIDTKGNNLFENNKKLFKERLERLIG